jgi:DNA primase
MLKEAVAFIGQIENIAEKNLFVRRIAERLGIDEGLLKNEAFPQAAGGRAAEVTGKSARPAEIARVDAVESSLILMMLSFPHKIGQIKETNVLDFFATENLKQLAEDIQKRFTAGKAVDPPSILDQLTDGTLRQWLLGRMVEESACDNDTLERVLSDTVIKIKKKWYKEKHRLLKLRLVKAQEAGDFDAINQLLMEKARLSNDEKAYL